MSAFWITVDVLAASILLRYVTPQLDENTITLALIIGVIVAIIRWF
jgi:hypothetical protein